MFTPSSLPAVVATHGAADPTRAMFMDRWAQLNPSADSKASLSERIICYGMLLERRVYGDSEDLPYSQHRNEVVHFYPPRNLRCYSTGNILGRLDRFDGEFLSRLAIDREFRLQLTYNATAPAMRPGQRKVSGPIGRLDIVIYGPSNRLSDIGDFVSQCGWFLDDPYGCDENVPYLNPQCLFSIHEEPPMTFDLCRIQGLKAEHFQQASANVLAGFETTDHISEAAKPAALRTNLKSHQLQALTFFQRRELGLHPSKNEVGIWSREIEHGSNLYVNILTGQSQRQPDPIWRGGILADEMGLGKTLSVIALIAADLDEQLTTKSAKSYVGPLVELCSTLVVVPPNVLPVWESQLKRHTVDGKLTWFYHHGKTKLQQSKRLDSYDIVFTTYHTIENEGRSSKARTGSLFSYHWKRIVLDEAHMIRNYATATARAVGALQADSRWAITGTPVQNNLTDFLGLFAFLHFAPYDDPKAFDEQISELWRTKPFEDAVETFKNLLSCIMIRRTTSILELPIRMNEIVTVPFDHEEERKYRQIERPLLDVLENEGNRNPDSPQVWATTIQQINKLRLFCNLGITTTHSRSSRTAQATMIDPRHTALAIRLSIGGDVCNQCLQPFEATLDDESLLGSPSASIYYTTCDILLCATCSNGLRYQSPKPCSCTNSQKSCILLPLSSDLLTPTPTPGRSLSPSPMDLDTISQTSSKVQALFERIESVPDEKHVVFSAWTSTLDMVERGLDSKGISWVRIDGKVANKKRGLIIEQFRNHMSIRVILITISCGACGLDLTAASQVHLLEPQWNPSVEDQALARAHRLGQTRPVTTYRYIMKDSFEEHILKVQDRKKLLATTLLSNESSIKLLQDLVHEGKQQKGVYDPGTLETSTEEEFDVCDETRIKQEVFE